MFGYERAKKAYDTEPTGKKLNDMLGATKHFTKYDELKVSDHRLSYELKRIADSLERLESILRDQ